jgi:hypothetical protein
VEGEKTGDGISYASHVKNPNPLKARATTFYDPVHNALDKEAQCAWKEGQGSYWPSVYEYRRSKLRSLRSTHYVLSVSGNFVWQNNSSLLTSKKLGYAIC